MYRNSIRPLVAVCALTLLSVPAPASAGHAWGGYHWARTANPFTLKLGSNLTTLWRPFLTTTSNDWTQSSVLNTTIVTGANRTPKNCKATAGRVEICNAAYGNNGWLGIAQVWISGSHITQGTVKVNDTYFSTAQYNTAAWRNLVMCQEVGHTLGLDHQDENHANAPLGTCMDYTSDPTPNQHPNLHDYQQLETIYGHLDSITTVSGANTSSPAAGQWGRLIRQSHDGRAHIYELDLGAGRKVFTFVMWA